MDALESFALEKFGTDTMLYLHVKNDNAAAQKFYQNPKRGYVAPTSEQLQNIDVRRLEDNAGTAGQILMCKSLLDCSLPAQQEKNDKDNVGGFGATRFVLQAGDGQTLCCSTGGVQTCALSRAALTRTSLSVASFETCLIAGRCQFCTKHIVFVRF